MEGYRKFVDEFKVPGEVYNRGWFQVESCWWDDRWLGSSVIVSHGQRKALGSSTGRATIFHLLHYSGSSSWRVSWFNSWSFNITRTNLFSDMSKTNAFKDNYKHKQPDFIQRKTSKLVLKPLIYRNTEIQKNVHTKKSKVSAPWYC